jgi:hypothetical protein
MGMMHQAEPPAVASPAAQNNNNSQVLVEIFCRLDVDGNGALSRAEIRQALILLGCDGQRAAIAELLDELWLDMRKDANGEVCLADFVQALQMMVPSTTSIPCTSDVVISSATASEDEEYSDDEMPEQAYAEHGPFAGPEWIASLSSLGTGRRRGSIHVRKVPVARAREDSDSSEVDHGDIAIEVENAITQQKYKQLVLFAKSILEENELLNDAAEELSTKAEQQHDDLMALKLQQKRLEQQLGGLREECAKHEV